MRQVLLFGAVHQQAVERTQVLQRFQQQIGMRQRLFAIRKGHRPGVVQVDHVRKVLTFCPFRNGSNRMHGNRLPLCCLPDIPQCVF